MKPLHYFRCDGCGYVVARSNETALVRKFLRHEDECSGYRHRRRSLRLLVLATFLATTALLVLGQPVFGVTR